MDPDKIPAPDLIIEVDIASDSRGRFPIFAAVGVQEIWHYRRQKVSFFQLSGDRYLESNASIWLPCLTPEIVQRFLHAREEMSSSDWTQMICRWVRETRA